MNRRRAIAALIGLPIAAPAMTPPPTRILVVYDSRIPAYGEALDGIRAGLGRPPETIDLSKADPTSAAHLAGAESTIIAVGMEALRAIAAARPAAPVVSIMVLRHEAAETQAAVAPVAELLLDTPLASLLERVRGAFPAMSRVGIIRNPALAPVDKATAVAQARQHGVALSIVECRGPAELLPGFLSLRGRVDAVLCFPDASLYNAATLKPLIVASLENRLPLIGFSASFVRAGAAIGVYPDFVDVGRQSAEIALRYSPASDARRVEERPRKLIVAINQKVFRLLGLKRPEDPTVAALQ